MQGYQGDDGAIVPLAGAAYRTGDVAMRDADGYFTYVGRADDVFKASDYRISPFELESALIEHAGGRRGGGGALARPAAPRRAEGVCRARRQPHRRTATPRWRSSAIVRARLAPFKRVRRLEFAELPKTISGKIRRVELRGTEAGAARGRRGAASTEFWEEDFPGIAVDAAGARRLARTHEPAAGGAPGAPGAPAFLIRTRR